MDNNINLSPEREKKWRLSGEGDAFNAMVREKAKKMKAEQNGIRGAMANAAKNGSNRLAAEAARVRTERNKEAEIMRVKREARAAKFAAMGGSRKRKTRKARKTRKDRR